MTKLDNAFKSLFEVNMGISCGERIVVFSDTIRSDESPSAIDADRRQRLLQAAGEAARYAEANYGNASFLHFPATPASGAEPPEVLWRAVFGDKILEEFENYHIFQRLLNKETTAEDLQVAHKIVQSNHTAAADVVIALANNSTSHTRFRALTNSAGGRFASLPGFDPEMFFTSMQVNWQQLAERTARLAELVNTGTEILLETANGTSMKLGKQGRFAAGDDGLLTKSGSFGNLPAGEVYLAPLEGTSEGVMVLEYAPTRKLASPLELVVKGGHVVEIRGNDPHKLRLEQKFSESDKNRNIAELGIGTNDRASRPDNILEAEKILGTIHIALGDNSGFGGTVQTPFHEDYVFYLPTLTVLQPGGKSVVILQEGKLVLPQT